MVSLNTAPAQVAWRSAPDEGHRLSKAVCKVYDSAATCTKQTGTCTRQGGTDRGVEVWCAGVLATVLVCVLASCCSLLHSPLPLQTARLEESLKYQISRSPVEPVGNRGLKLVKRFEPRQALTPCVCSAVEATRSCQSRTPHPEQKSLVWRDRLFWKICCCCCRCCRCRGAARKSATLCDIRAVLLCVCGGKQGGRAAEFSHVSTHRSHLFFNLQ